MSTARQNITRLPQLYTIRECSNSKSTAPDVMLTPNVAKFRNFKSLMDTHTHTHTYDMIIA